MRTFGILPVGRTHQNLAVLLTLLAMKFVDWYEVKIVVETKMFKRRKRERDWPTVSIVGRGEETEKPRHREEEKSAIIRFFCPCRG